MKQRSLALFTTCEIIGEGCVIGESPRVQARCTVEDLVQACYCCIKLQLNPMAGAH